MRNIRWGILGPGAIAHSFTKGLTALPDAVISAVGSRSLERAREFAQQYKIATSYGSYEELVHDPQVDIIYVATPHTLHKECILLCLNAGKAVLCEKPFTLNAKEAEEVIHCARSVKQFLMEGMWTRFLPAIVKVRELLKNQVIGDIRQVKADFGFQADWNPENRLFNPQLGGGALLDVGIYSTSFASMVFGVQPSQISSLSYLGETGVDEQYMALFGYQGGKLAALSGAVRTETPHDALILGTDGYIKIPDFWHAQSVILSLKGMEIEKFDIPYLGTGYQYEAAEAMKCIREGKLESHIMPLQESLDIMKTLDHIRMQWGLKYPAEI
ncbi:Gfo/Idh/MocA family protein [Pelosinus sp. sgz500959]|uniref:Gfo/Idh/MocA family protein n=1 Tax=Pelosinus sp. sgz500959 TaxID=3242472 RepID=UPI0036704E24